MIRRHDSLQSSDGSPAFINGKSVRMDNFVKLRNACLLLNMALSYPLVNLGLLLFNSVSLFDLLKVVVYGLFVRLPSFCGRVYGNAHN